MCFLSFFFLQIRHQYDAYKHQLLRCSGLPPRERSPRARRFFHRRQPRDLDRNGGIRNDRGRRRRRPNDNNFSKESNNQEQNNENAENKKKPRRRNYNRNRKAKTSQTEQNKDDTKIESIQLTESNLSTLLSELNMGNKSLNTANSTSSESLDFEKINTEDTNPCSATMTAASSRLAASFNKGN